MVRGNEKKCRMMCAPPSGRVHTVHGDRLSNLLSLIHSLGGRVPTGSLGRSAGSLHTVCSHIHMCQIFFFFFPPINCSNVTALYVTGTLLSKPCQGYNTLSHSQLSVVLAFVSTSSSTMKEKFFPTAVGDGDDDDDDDEAGSF